MTHTIIGAVDNYKWDDIKIWATSLKESGFTGDVVVLVYRASQDLISNCIKLGFNVLLAEYDEFGRPIQHNKFGLPTQAHKMRNFHAYQYLSSVNHRIQDYNERPYMTIITDTRDVCFQRNPDDYFQERYMSPCITMPSENVLFKDEPWNMGMVTQLFGPIIADGLKNKHACNSGTFFGPSVIMKKFLLHMFLVERDFSSTGSDQPTMNVLGHSDALTHVLPMNEGWAFQCGTTIDPKKNFPQITPLNHKITSDGIVTLTDGTPYVILHQYERVPSLKALVEKRYA
jgi:hypothetical protein